VGGVSGVEEGKLMSEAVRTQMKLSAVIFEVPDVETLDACRDWYVRLGLEKAPFDSPGESYWFDLGAGLFGIHTGGTAHGCSLWLDVPDVDDAYARLSTAGFAFDAPPSNEPYGRVARLTDPAGSAVRLITS
jgi:catechol 2,3-dioxygenase-like lactoylglutathione lyase family enzyme